ncbi:hypothetical protein GCM10023091_38040 [Ravibacter arvi]|uniref:DUF4440 domain-containing protein n=1 Tax=Ravibacter arvi TaxID=2051041 RepID=A0ABP8MB12_9BACT
MKIKLLFFVLLFAAGPVFAQSPPVDATSAGREFLQALADENTASLRSLMGNDFILLSFDGQSVDANTLLEAVGSGYLVIDSGNSQGNYTRLFQDTGIVTGTWTVKGALQGQSFNNRLTYSLVMVKQGGAWKVVSVQFTPS